MQGEVKGLHAKWMLTWSTLTIAKANWNLGSQESKQYPYTKLITVISGIIPTRPGYPRKPNPRLT